LFCFRRAPVRRSDSGSGKRRRAETLGGIINGQPAKRASELKVNQDDLRKRFGFRPKGTALINKLLPAKAKLAIPILNKKPYMKIVICGSMTCGSMTSAKKMIEIKNDLHKLNHEAVLPKFTGEYAQIDNLDKIHSESAKNKINHDLIRNYFTEIKNADAILVVNLDKNGIDNYIGGNAFLEMGFAHVLDKKIFLLNPIPNISYKDEIEAMQPIILNNNLKLIS
jgi:nucleoside 2-deoxyribosyltransferase